MQTSVHVTFRDMPVSDAVEAKCWSEAEKLEHHFNRIVGCHVTIAAASRGRHRPGRLYDVDVYVTVPGREFVESRRPERDRVGENLDVAIREAFERMRTRLLDYARTNDVS